MRVDLYSAIHKAQRKYLFEISIAIGSADPSDPVQVAGIQQKIKDAILNLKDHADNEKTYIHPRSSGIKS